MVGRLDWPFERVQQLRELWATDMSRPKIADAMGLSINAISAKVARLGLPSKVAQPKQRQPSPRPPAQRPAPVAPEAARPIPVPTGRNCLWPTWEHRDAAYWAAIRAGTVLECGAVRASVADVYCAEHKRDARGSRTT